MKKSIKMFMTIAVFTLTIISCKKDTLIPVQFEESSQPTHKVGSRNGARSPIDTSLIYSACGMKTKVFVPNPNVLKRYSFAIDYKGQRQNIRISNGKIYFDHADKFSFEFAGYADTAQRVQTWRIKRTDGQYLTGSYSYGAKLSGSQEPSQIFLLSAPINGLTKIMLPKLAVCSLLAIWFHIDYQWYVSATLDYNHHQIASALPIYLVEIPLSAGF